MRYGCYNPRAPALLAGGVVAGPGACPLVASSRLADASFAMHLAAVGRAVAMPPIATSADDHQPVAPRAVEHPVALVDYRAPATEGWTPGPPPATLSLSLESSLWRWHRSPDCYANGLGFVFSVEALFYRTNWWPVTHPSMMLGISDPAICPLPARYRGQRDPGQEPHRRYLPAGNQIQEACAWGESHIQGTSASGKPRAIRLSVKEEENHTREETRSTRLTPGR